MLRRHDTPGASAAARRGGRDGLPVRVLCAAGARPRGAVARRSWVRAVRRRCDFRGAFRRAQACLSAPLDRRLGAPERSPSRAGRGAADALSPSLRPLSRVPDAFSRLARGVAAVASRPAELSRCEVVLDKSETSPT